MYSSHLNERIHFLVEGRKPNGICFLAKQNVAWASSPWCTRKIVENHGLEAHATDKVDGIGRKPSDSSSSSNDGRTGRLAPFRYRFEIAHFGWRSLLSFCLGIILNSPMFAQTTEVSNATLGKIEIEDPALEGLIDKSSPIEILADGFTWTEGPVWIGSAEQGHLLFSDIPRNSIFRWKQGEGVSLFMNPSGYTGVTYYGLEPGSNGLLLDQDRNLVMCEHGDRRVSVLTPEGGKRTLADAYQGKRLNSPNDAVLKSNGDIYFTDPPYGLPKREKDPRRELDHFGVYRISRKTGEVTLLTTRLQRPNGIAFSPDEKTLYVAQSDPKQAIWMAFDVKVDGTIGEGRVLYDVTGDVGSFPGLPDGMSVDRQGNLWASGPGGIFVISPAGKRLGRIFTGQKTSNCCFGEDGMSLFITADMFLCRVRTKVRGL